MNPLYPTPTTSDVSHYIGLPISSLPAPACILDLPTLRRNCRRLRHLSASLGVQFRPHTKTHKTLSLTRLQLEGLGHGNVIVSTVAEAEALEPLVEEGAVTGILYGFPLPPSARCRLLQLRERHPELQVTVLVDHVDQLPEDGKGWLVFVKLDNGYQRAGLKTESPELLGLLKKIKDTGAELKGFYSHAGHSYGAKTAEEAVEFLAKELETVVKGVDTLDGLSGSEGNQPFNAKGLVLSVGATPTALAAEGMRERIRNIQEKGWIVELHAGVYTTMDLQQLTTGPESVTSDSSESSSDTKTESTAVRALDEGDIAITVLAEVASVYPDRGEALLAIGSTGLGREPGRIPGWGVLTGWRDSQSLTPSAWDGKQKSGWTVGRISQEHAVLTKDPAFTNEPMELKVGQKVRIWPQHSCIAGNCYGWYYVVEDGRVVDVWVRCRGW
ncbi:putative serine dehydratase domain-containing protein [Pyronema omphalodes]|nr:putative serine dehydratase domain-containing protein [Pyronema omphalodes]KAI5816129.1 putative serine dehydratase domain-containing protein [Pyronema omphalodes]